MNNTSQRFNSFNFRLRKNKIMSQKQLRCPEGNYKIKVFNKILRSYSEPDEKFCDLGTYLFWCANVNLFGKFEDNLYIITKSNRKGN